MKIIKQEYKLKSKRDPNLITPCCGKKNRGSSGSIKFVNYEGLPDRFGYCHSCGKATLPPPIYQDDNGVQYTYNKIANKFERLQYFRTTPKTISQPTESDHVNQRFIDEEVAIKSLKSSSENNLLKYLRATYNSSMVDEAKEQYLLGTYNDGATMFWEINKSLQVQKCKLSYYTIEGRRTERFNHLYTIKEGYYSCLYGEHLICDNLKGRQILALVESEKTAIVASILLPKYTWLSYGGKNGLNQKKYEALIGHKVLVVPDIENNAVNIIAKKIVELRKLGVDARIWDMTNGQSDEKLKELGIYGKDLEDLFREIS